MAGPDRPHQAEVPVEPPLVRRVAALPAGLAGRHARRGLSALCRARRHRRQLGDPRLQPGPVGRHALRDQRRDHRLRRHQRRHDRLHAGARARAIAGAGFVFPDDEDLIQAEFERTLDFHLGLARSAAQPADPGLAGRDRGSSRSTSTRTTSTRRTGRQSLFDFKFSGLLRRSAGGPGARQAQPRAMSPSTTASTAARCRAHRRANGPAGSATDPATVPTTTSSAARSPAPTPGDSVRVWFEGGGETQRLVHLHGRVRQRQPGPGPLGGGLHRRVARQARCDLARNISSFYTDALTANGVAFDVYDVDAHDRTAADGLGVLAPLRRHRLVHRRRRRDTRARWGPGNASRLAMQEIARGARLRQRGRARALHRAGAPASSTRTALGTQLYDPFENRECVPNPAVEARCLALSGSGDSQGDPIEYTFGAAITTPGAGLDPNTGDPFDVTGIDDPLAGPDVGVQRRGQRSEPVQRLVVHRDERLPQGDRSGGQLPAIRELAGGRVPERDRGTIRAAQRAVVHVVAIAPTRPISA